MLLFLSLFSSAIPMRAAEPPLEAVWSGDPRWMTGRFWVGEPNLKGQGTTFFESIGPGSNFFGSNVHGTGLRKIEIRFSSDATSKCQTYNRNNNYAPSGVGIFPGSAWDLTAPSNPRRLNICFTEDPAFQTPNFVWDPITQAYGGREFVFIMNSDYDSTGMLYALKNIKSQANTLDILYAWWPRLQYPYRLLESLPATLTIKPYAFAPTTESSRDRVTIRWDYFDFEPGITQTLIYAGTDSSQMSLRGSVAGTARSFTDNDVDFLDTLYYRLEAVNEVGMALGESPIIRAIVLARLEVVGRWDGRSDYTDVWGYTDSITGREYALIGVHFGSPSGGVSIVDVTANPPVEVGFAASGWSGGLRVYKNYLVTASDASPAKIYDLTVPSAPALMSTIAGGQAHTLNVYKDYVFLHGANNAAINIYNISNPSAPQFISNYLSFYFHDTGIRNDTLAGAGIYGEGIEFVDISDIANPRRIGGFNYTGSGAHNVEFSQDGKTLYVGDEIGSGKWTRVFDITDISNATKIADIIVNPQATVHNSYLKDSLLYIAHYTEGVRVWNVKDPAAPFEVAYYDTYAPANFGFDGVWTVYPHFGSGKIIASDRQSGLWVFRLESGPTAADGGGTITLPEDYRVGQNYPNPFNPATTIPIYMSHTAHARLEVLNTLGQSVRTLLNARIASGQHNIIWDGLTESQGPAASGVYFARLTVAGRSVSRPMVHLK